MILWQYILYNNARWGLFFLHFSRQLQIFHLQNTQQVLLMLMEKVAVVRKAASRGSQVGWGNSCTSEGTKSALPSGGTVQGVWLREARSSSQEIPSWGTWLASAAPQENGSLCYHCPKREGYADNSADWPLLGQRVRWGPVPIDWLFQRLDLDVFCWERGFPGWSDGGSLIEICLCQNSCLQGHIWTKLWPVFQWTLDEC